MHSYPRAFLVASQYIGGRYSSASSVALGSVAETLALTPVLFLASRCLVLSTPCSGLGTSGLCSRRQAGTRRVRGIQPGAPQGNVAAICDSGSTVKAASTCQRRVLVRRPADQTAGTSPREGSLSSSTGKAVASRSPKAA